MVHQARFDPSLFHFRYLIYGTLDILVSEAIASKDDKCSVHDWYLLDVKAEGRDRDVFRPLIELTQWSESLNRRDHIHVTLQTQDPLFVRYKPVGHCAQGKYRPQGTSLGLLFLKIQYILVLYAMALIRNSLL